MSVEQKKLQAKVRSKSAFSGWCRSIHIFVYQQKIIIFSQILMIPLKSIQNLLLETIMIFEFLILYIYLKYRCFLDSMCFSTIIFSFFTLSLKEIFSDFFLECHPIRKKKLYKKVTMKSSVWMEIASDPGFFVANIYLDT